MKDLKVLESDCGPYCEIYEILKAIDIYIDKQVNFIICCDFFCK